MNQENTEAVLRVLSHKDKFYSDLVSELQRAAYHLSQAEHSFNFIENRVSYNPATLREMRLTLSDLIIGILGELEGVRRIEANYRKKQLGSDAKDYVEKVKKLGRGEIE